MSEPLGARAFVGVGQDQLEDYAPVQEIGVGFLFRNSLLPKSLGSGVDYNFLELCSLFNNFRKSVGDFRSPFKEMDINQGFSNMFNQVSVSRSRKLLKSKGSDQTGRDQQRQRELLRQRFELLPILFYALFSAAFHLVLFSCLWPYIF